MKDEEEKGLLLKNTTGENASSFLFPLIQQTIRGNLLLDKRLKKKGKRGENRIKKTAATFDDSTVKSVFPTPLLSASPFLCVCTVGLLCHCQPGTVINPDQIRSHGGNNT